MANETETEVCIYAKIGDWDGLSQASKVIPQHHLESTFSNHTRCRVRETGDQYEFTFKIPHQTDFTMTEQNITVDRSFWEDFHHVAEYQLVKTRYIFESTSVQTSIIVDDIRQTIELPKVIYEVDVYKDQHGQPVQWCKIDIEVDTILEYLRKHVRNQSQYGLKIKVSHLPFKPLGPIMSDTTDERDGAFIEALWRDHYRIPMPK